MRPGSLAHRLEAGLLSPSRGVWVWLTDAAIQIVLICVGIATYRLGDVQTSIGDKLFGTLVILGILYVTFVIVKVIAERKYASSARSTESIIAETVFEDFLDNLDNNIHSRITVLRPDPVFPNLLSPWHRIPVAQGQQLASKSYFPYGDGGGSGLAGIAAQFPGEPHFIQTGPFASAQARDEFFVNNLKMHPEVVGRLSEYSINAHATFAYGLRCNPGDRLVAVVCIDFLEAIDPNKPPFNCDNLCHELDKLADMLDRIAR